MKSFYCFALIIFAASAAPFFSQYYPLADEIISHMSLDQKIGQTIQVDYDQFNKRSDNTQYEQIDEYLLGSVLIGGNGCPDGQGNVKVQNDYVNATMENWQKITEMTQAHAVKVETPDGEVKIKLLLGTDAVHGNQHVLGEILYPQNIGLAASHNPRNFATAGYWNGKSVKKSGFNFAFAPTVAMSHNPQWGRFYETMGDDPKWVYQFAKAYVQGVQQIDGAYLEGVLASTKHFLGDGATINGNDEGNCRVYDMLTFLDHNLQGYKAAVEVNTATVMVSYSAINDHYMTINGELMTGLLKDDMGFDGFLISDYDAVGKINHQGQPSSGVKLELKQAYLMSLSAGMDMMMLMPNADDQEVYRYINIVKELLDEGDLQMSRLDDMVRRILATKLAMRLVEVPQVLAEQYNYSSIPKEQAPEHPDAKDREYMDALRAAQESLVLLKNDEQTLPLNRENIEYVVLVGEREIEGKWVFQDYDNIGAQNGGWSVRWQGFEGNDYWSGDLKEQSRASSILDALKRAVPDAKLLYTRYDDNTDFEHVQAQRDVFLAELQAELPNMTKDNTVIIGAIAESPYAEFMGDVNNKFCKGTGEWVEGCIYNAHINDYMPWLQRTTLDLGYQDFSKQVVQLVQAQDDVKLVTVLFSGRPMMVNETIDASDAFVAAWWPGTTGGHAVVSALFGHYRFRQHPNANTLPCPWIQEMESLHNYPFYNKGEVPRIENALFESGYGLSTAREQPEEIQE